MTQLLVFMSLLLLPTFALSQEPAATPSIASRNPKEHSRKAEYGTNGYNRGTEQNPVFIKEISPEPSEEIHTAEADDHDRKASYEWWTVVSTVTIAAFTVIMGVWTILLWRESKRTAWFTGQTVETMKDTAARQLRAYVFAKTDDKAVVVDDAGILSVTTIVKNFGQTPAHNMITSQHIGTYILPISSTNPLDKPSFADNSSKSALAPSEVTYIRNRPKKRLTQNLISAIESGQAALFVVGEIKYDDVFGKPHRTRYCMFSTGEVFVRKGLTYYHDGNEAD